MALRGWRLVLLAAACLGLAYLFNRFGSEVADRELAAFDRAVRDWVVAHRFPAGIALFRAVTLLGDKRVLVPAALLVGWALVRRGARLRPLLIAVTPIVVLPLVTLVKHFFRVGRPPTGIAASLGWSFPSGHAAGTTAVAVVLSYVLLRERLTTGATLVIGALLALLVGVSRVYLDLHWTSDVLGGWVIGASYGAGCCALYEWARDRTERPSSLAPGP